MWQGDRVARLADSGTIAVENVTPARPLLLDTATEILVGTQAVQQVQSGVQAHASLVPVTLDRCIQIEATSAAGQQIVVSVQAQAQVEDSPPQPSTPVTQDAPAVSSLTAASTSPSSSGGGPRAALPPPHPLPHHFWLGGIKQLGRQWQQLHLLQGEWPHHHLHHHHHRLPQVEVRQALAAHHRRHHHRLGWSRLVWQGPSRRPGAQGLLRALV